MLRRHGSKLVSAANAWLDGEPARERARKVREKRRAKEARKGGGGGLEAEVEAEDVGDGEIRARAGYLRGEVVPRAYL